MKATAKSIFGTNLEQEVLDEVVILPVAIRNVGAGSITLPVGMKWTDFESLELGMGIHTYETLYENDVLPSSIIQSQPTSWTTSLSFIDTNGFIGRLTITAISDTQASWDGSCSVVSQTTWPYYLIGYKRRISRVGIDELMSAMSLPNLIANADLTDNPINQRNFNGDWAALAVGAYGYDQWMKVSSTHMGYVIEAGKYRPSTKHTFTKDDVVIGEFMSPASGHWTVAVPFATSGKFDLYAGQFKRPWHPVLGGEDRCKRYFERKILSFRAYVVGDQYGVYDTIDDSSRYFKIPSVSVISKGTGNGVIDIVVGTHTRSVLKSPTAQTGFYSVDNFLFTLDASITLAELNGQIIYLQ